MARTAKPWFDQQSGWWTIWIGRKRVRLTQGKKNKKAAIEQLEELRVAARLNPPPDHPDQSVASVIELYEGENRKRLAPETFCLRHLYLQSFAEFCGWKSVSSCSEDDMEAWLDQHPEWIPPVGEQLRQKPLQRSPQPHFAAQSEQDYEQGDRQSGHDEG